MSTATRPLITARLEDGRIILRSPYNAVFVAFARGLPSSRWNSGDKTWSCEATPAAAHRVCREAPGEVQASDAVRDLAAAFVASQLPTIDNAEQPPKRKHDSRRHQVAGYHFAMQRDAAMLAHEMGAGKSKVAVDLIQNRDCRAVLIICPVSVRGVWRREFAKWAVDDYTVVVLETGTIARKIATARVAMAGCEARNERFVIVTNYETARDKTFQKLVAERVWDAVVLDESHRAKSHNSSISKACHEIGKHARFRLCLTGTPMPHSPLDIFGQFRFLDAGIFGSAFGQFRSQYAVQGPLGPYHVVGYKNQDKLAEKMALLAHSVRMSDTTIELPPVTHQTLTAPLQDAKAYHELEEHMITQVKDGTITAANALVKMLRLQQWTSGFCIDEDGTEILTGTEKRDLLQDLLQDIPPDEPVVVFGNFVRSLDFIAEVAQKLDRTYGEISGRRKDLTPNAEMPPGIQILGVQIAAGGVGIDLTLARYAVYYDHGWSLGNYEQSLARVHRPGQTRPTVYYHLVVDRTVDVQTVKALERKKQVVEVVIEHMRGSTR